MQLRSEQTGNNYYYGKERWALRVLSNLSIRNIRARSITRTTAGTSDNFSVRQLGRLDYLLLKYVFLERLIFILNCIRGYAPKSPLPFPPSIWLLRENPRSRELVVKDPLKTLPRGELTTEPNAQFEFSNSTDKLCAVSFDVGFYALSFPG